MKIKLNAQTDLINVYAIKNNKRKCVVEFRDDLGHYLLRNKKETRNVLAKFFNAGVGSISITF